MHREQRDEAEKQEVVRLLFRKESSIMVSWAGFTDSGSLSFLIPPLLLLSFLSFSSFFLLLFIFFVLPPSTYSINHAVVLWRCNGGIS